MQKRQASQPESGPGGLVIPEPSRWDFPRLDEFPPEEDLVAVGADLAPGTILAAYASACFPMPINRKQLGWFSPDPRGILRPGNIRVTRSLRQSMRRYEVTVNRAFNEVVDGCADPKRSGAWINRDIAAAYEQLNRMGWAHSIEVWDDAGLAGGLYGLSIGRLFAGESMFHHRRDASKVALVYLAELVGGPPEALIDVQWLTPHLESMGAEQCSRRDYFGLLSRALDGGLQPSVSQSANPSPRPSLGSEFDRLNSTQLGAVDADGSRASSEPPEPST